MIYVLAVYPNRPGSRFDTAYYFERHVPFAQRLLAPYGLTLLRFSQGQEQLNGSPPDFWMLSEMHFVSRAAFDAGMSACGTALFEDSINYTDVVPILQLNVQELKIAIPSPTEHKS